MITNIEVSGLLSPFGHIAWTAIAATVLSVARRPAMATWATIRSPRFLRLFAVPVSLHFVWNLGVGGPFMVKDVVLGFVAWVVIISVVQSGLREMDTLAHPVTS